MLRLESPFRFGARGKDVNGVVGSTTKINAGDVQFYGVLETFVDVLHPARKAEAARKSKTHRDPIFVAVHLVDHARNKVRRLGTGQLPMRVVADLVCALV
eukprot:5219331-Pleurochrysis_carterae.AAC.1